MKFSSAFLLLMFIQTPQPAPPKVSNDSVLGTSEITKKSKQISNKATLAPPQNKETPVSGEREIEKEPSNGKLEHVIVDKFPDKDEWDKVYIGLTGALVLIGVSTLVGIWYQAVQTRKSVSAMEKSTGILMSIEQGRILTYWDQIIHIDLSPNGVHDGRLSHYFNWYCRNVGKTEARLSNVWARFIVLHTLAELPVKPDYDAPNGLNYNGEPLQPNSTAQQTIYFTVPLETELPFDEMQAKHRKGELFLYAYGYAKYSDVWGRTHEARFGVLRVPQYKLTLDNWVIAGPSEYNESH